MIRWLVVVALCGCSSSEKSEKAVERPASVTDEMVAVLDRDAAIVRKVATLLEASKGDCKKAAQIVKEHMAEVAEATKSSQQVRQAARNEPALMNWIKATYKTKQNEEAGKLLRTTAKACLSDPDYKAAMEAQIAANKA